MLIYSNILWLSNFYNSWATCLSSATITSNFCSCRNTQQASARLNQPKNALVKTISTPSIVSTLSEVPVLILVSAIYTKKNLKRITILYLDLFLET